MAVSQLLDYAGTISFENYITSSKLVRVTDQDRSYPASNLLDPRLSSKYRTTQIFNGRNGYFEVVFDAGSDIDPTVVAIIGSNITKTSGNGLYLIGADNPALTSNPRYYDSFSLYETNSNVLRWYLDTATSGSGGKRYWGFRFYPHNWGDGFVEEDYFEFSNFWLGEYYPFQHNLDKTTTLSDISKRDDSFSGAIFSDVNNVQYDVSNELKMIDSRMRHDIVNGFARNKSVAPVLVDLAPFSNSSERVRDVYYAKLKDKIGIDHVWNGYSNLSIDLEEIMA